MTVIVTACSAFGLTVFEAKTEIICLQTKYGEKVSFAINAAGQVYKQTIEFVYSGGAISANRDLSVEVTRRLQRAWAFFQRYKIEIYDRPGVRLRLKVKVAESPGDRDTTLRLHDVEPEQTQLWQATTGSPLHAPPIPRISETEARRPHPIVRRRACQDSSREHRGDSAQTEDNACEIRSTYGGGASATEGDVRGACWG